MIKGKGMVGRKYEKAAPLCYVFDTCDNSSAIKTGRPDLTILQRSILAWV